MTDGVPGTHKPWVEGLLAFLALPHTLLGIRFFGTAWAMLFFALAVACLAGTAILLSRPSRRRVLPALRGR